MTEVLIAWCDNSLLDLADPSLDLSACTLWDIGTTLDRFPRWGARGRYHYGVAAHSLFVAELASRAGHDDPQTRLECLLHDATEAFVGDMTSNLKARCPEFQTLEQNVRDALARRFGLACFEPPIVKQFDLQAREIERRFLFDPIPYGMLVQASGEYGCDWTSEVMRALKERKSGEV